MLDPISVAGLALAVFDEVLKLGAKTTEVITEMRTFDDVSIRTIHLRSQLIR